MKVLSLFMVMIFAFIGNAQTNAPDSLTIGADSVALALDSTKANVLSWEENTIFESKTDKQTLPQNDTLTFTAAMLMTDNPLHYRFEQLEPPQDHNLKLITTSSANKTEVVDGETKYIREYIFKYIPENTGMAYINPAEITFTHLPSNTTRKMQTARLEVEVTDPVLPPDFTWLKIVLIIVIALSIIGAIVWYFFFRKTDEELESNSGIPLETEIGNKLGDVKEHLKRNDFESFYNSMPVLIRDYFGRKFDFPAKGMSSLELIEELENRGIGGKDLVNLKESLQICDQVRFAKESGDENQAHKVIGGFEKILRSFEPQDK